MSVIDQTWLAQQLETCQNRFDGGDDYESVERQNIDEAYYGYEREKIDGNYDIVSQDFQNTVDTLMPELVRPFVSRHDSFFKLNATTQNSEQYEESAQEAIRYILRKNNEYSLVNDWFKNSLMYSIGVVKFYIDDNVKILTHSYEDITEEELETLLYILDENKNRMENPNVTVVGEVNQKENGLIDVQIREVKEGSPKIKIKVLPPEEFLYPAAANSIHEAPIIAHSYYIADYELLKRGFDADVVHRQSASRVESTEQQERERNSTLGNQESHGLSGKYVKVTEAYIRAEETGEMRQVTALGTSLEIVKDVAWPYRLPFALITPISMPNRIQGIGMWELVKDIQYVKTQLLRQGLDNHQRTNDTKFAVNAENTDIKSILESRAGQIIQCTNPHQDIVPITVGNISNNVLAWMAHLDELKDARIGNNKAMSGLDPNALAGVSNIVAAQAIKSGTSKVDYILRNFAETGMQDLVLGLLEIIFVAFPEGMKFSGSTGIVQYMPSDHDEFDYDITIGLGTVGEEQNVAQLEMIAQVQEKIMMTLGKSNETAPISKWISTIHEILKASGYKNPEKYFSLEGAKIIEKTPDPEPEPDPLVEAQVVEANSRVDIAAAELSIKQQQLELNLVDLELKKQELERKKLDDYNDAAIAKEKLELEEKKLNV